MYFVVNSLVKTLDEGMATGQSYMNSLTKKDIHIWEERTEKYLNESGQGEADFYFKDVPPELRQIGILGIHKDTNWVSYSWVGGLDHTELDVERLADGSFEFTAVYNDESNKVIWPKPPNIKNSQTN